MELSHRHDHEQRPLAVLAPVPEHAFGGVDAVGQRLRRRLG
jgi:hypothetical protein